MTKTKPWRWFNLASKWQYYVKYDKKREETFNLSFELPKQTNKRTNKQPNRFGIKYTGPACRSPFCIVITFSKPNIRLISIYYMNYTYVYIVYLLLYGWEKRIKRRKKQHLHLGRWCVPFLCSTQPLNMTFIQNCWLPSESRKTVRVEPTANSKQKMNEDIFVAL